MAEIAHTTKMPNSTSISPLVNERKKRQENSNLSGFSFFYTS